jgi:hypothetical protein
MLPNFTFRALTMHDGQPQASDPVVLQEKPELTGNEMHPRKAKAWAESNTGTPREHIIRRIEQELAA